VLRLALRHSDSDKSAENDADFGSDIIGTLRLRGESKSGIGKLGEYTYNDGP
jgi:hypothetical protein